MKLINKDTDYAVRALLFMAKSDKEIVSASELALELKISKPFLRKIMQALQKGGVLKSIKGNNGGFKLAKGIGNIYLIDLIRIFHGKLKLINCVIRNSPCSNRNNCALRSEISEVEEYVLKKIKKVNIKQLLNKQ